MGRRSGYDAKDGRDLAGADLRQTVFEDIRLMEGDRGFNFARANLRGSVFRGCLFRDSDFQRSDLSECEMRDVTFRDCEFELVALHSALLDKVEVVGAAARNAGITQCTCRDNRFSRCDLSVSNIHNSLFEECEFVDVALEGTSIHHNHYYRCRFTRCDLSQAIVSNCIFTECTFEGSKLDLSAVKTGGGLSLEELRRIEILDGEERVSPDALKERLEWLFEDHRAAGDVLEAANLSLTLDRKDLLEDVLADAPALLARASAGVAGDQWLNLCRNLLHWAQQGRMDAYWLSWVFQSLVDHVRSSQRTGSLPDYRLIEAATLLSGAVQAHQTALAEAAYAALPQVGLADTVRVVVEAPAEEDPRNVVALLESIDAAAARQVPASFLVEGRLLRLHYQGSRRGSLLVDLNTWALGAAAALVLLSQAGAVIRGLRGVVRESEGLVKDGASLVRTWRAERASLKAGASSVEHPEGPPLPRPALVSSQAPAEGALASDPRALQAASERNLAVNVTANLVLPPDRRKEVRRVVVSVEILP